MNEKINEIEPQDIEEFLKECLAKAEEIGVSLDYYLDEFV
jgi:transcription antitermination factor NusA-like protein|tara:strand:+ start:1016 stop:1135 length:120 start_codon:yes stop_codon:yes gene_type:complete